LDAVFAGLGAGLIALVSVVHALLFPVMPAEGRRPVERS
jgi:hypothetical protein